MVAARLCTVLSHQNGTCTNVMPCCWHALAFSESLLLTLVMECPSTASHLESNNNDGDGEGAGDGGDGMMMVMMVMN